MDTLTHFIVGVQAPSKRCVKPEYAKPEQEGPQHSEPGGLDPKQFVPPPYLLLNPA